jgi:hypothetical protein
MRTAPSARRRAAYHEAGHAVAQHVLGLGVGWISIGSDGRGVCAAPRAAEHALRPRERAARSATASLSGIEAELRLEPGLIDSAGFADHMQA